jgi:iron complex outermembrane recepter protein
MRKCIYILLFVIVKTIGAAQSDSLCNINISGKIICVSTNEVLPFATIYIKETGTGITANDKGIFNLNKLCKGKYTLQINDVGHLTIDTVIQITDNKFYTFNLPKDKASQLNEVTIEDHQVKKQEVETLQKDEISGEALDRTRGSTLGESLKSITGVNTLQTGASIFKPMIHGMYGTRVLIFNNGVKLESQQWGSDHAPEIDPFIATKLSVIKGAASIRYGMGAIGGVVLVDPKDPPTSKCIQGEVNLVGATNGRSGTGSGFLEGAFDKKLIGLSWRVQGTLKQAGSYSTPTYYLTNTAVKENNYSGALAYNRKNFGADVYYSSFNTTLGIYAGSVVGNLQDLLFLFKQQQPIVPSIFSYDIGRGYQTVHHQTLKAKGYYNFKNAGKLTYTYAWQSNKRSEYGDDPNLNPALANVPDDYFWLFTNASDLIFEHKPIGNISGSIGANYITQGNVYQGLDIRQLIPNYLINGGGAFILEKWSKRKLTIEAGARYDYEWMQTYTEDFSTQIKRSSTYSWGNVSGTLGAIYRINHFMSLNSSLGIGWRPPAPIELFALGIHQSAASFEIGDSTLKAERCYNAQSYLNFNYNRFHAEIGAYFSKINNYIYLRPLPNAPVTTIDGTYPAFKYTAANVYITGVDADFNLAIFKSNPIGNISIISKSTIVYGYNESINNYLIYMPANRTDNGLSFTKDSYKRFKQLFFNVSALVVATQNHVPPNSDYVPPPKGYWLLNASLGFSVKVKQQQISISLSGTNLLNTIYRDYLDRFRYFANELGRNITLRLKIPFSILKSKIANAP